MKKRFTEKSRTGRGSIPKNMRRDIYSRDEYTCQFCKQKFHSSDLTIDHLVPLALGGLDEITNYVTCCHPCNQQKADQTLADFAKSVNIKIDELPIHGDPIIDNEGLPIEIRLLRKHIFERIRQGKFRARGASAQRKIEKEYRRKFWETPLGRELEDTEPLLPGHVRIMIPEIKTLAKTGREYLLLVELAKSANTRDLIGSVLKRDIAIEDRVRSMANRNQNSALGKRLNQALKRFERTVKRYNA